MGFPSALSTTQDSQSLPQHCRKIGLLVRTYDLLFREKSGNLFHHDFWQKNVTLNTIAADVDNLLVELDGKTQDNFLSFQQPLMMRMH